MYEHHIEDTVNDSKSEAYLVATPTGLAELFDAVEIALFSPSGRASVELMPPSGEECTLHIIRTQDCEAVSHGGKEWPH